MAKENNYEKVVITKTEAGGNKLYLQKVYNGSMVWTNNLNEAIDFKDNPTVIDAIRNLNKMLVEKYRPARGTEIFKEDPNQVHIVGERHITNVTPIVTATFMKK